MGRYSDDGRTYVIEIDTREDRVLEYIEKVESTGCEGKARLSFTFTTDIDKAARWKSHELQASGSAYEDIRAGFSRVKLVPI